MRWFSLFITAYFWLYAVVFLFIGMEEKNNNALVMSAFMVFFSIIVTQITIRNFRKTK